MSKFLLVVAALATLLLLREGVIGLTLDIVKTQTQADPPSLRDNEYCSGGEYDYCSDGRACCGGNSEEGFPTGECCPPDRDCNDAKICVERKEYCYNQNSDETVQGNDQCDSECKRRGYIGGGCCTIGNDKSNSKPLVDIISGGNTTYDCASTKYGYCTVHCDCCNSNAWCDRKKYKCYVPSESAWCKDVDRAEGKC